MKITAVVTLYPPECNAGAELYLHSFLRDRVQRGDTCTVLVLGAWQGDQRLDGVRVVHHSAMLGPDRDADIVIGQLGGLTTAAQLAREVDAPLCAVAHSRDQVVQGVAAGAALVICNSRNVAEQCRVMGLDAWLVAPPVIYCDDYQPTARQRERLTRRCVTLVNLSDLKGAYQFYRIAEQLPSHRFIGVLGGWDQQLPAVRPNVEIYEHTDDMRGVYARTRVLLMPSRSETFGRCAAEAACCGIPTIANPTDGLVECLGDAGLFFQRDNTAQWVEALRCLDDPENYDCHSTQARQRALELAVEAQAGLDRADRWLRAVTGDAADPTKATPRPRHVSAGDAV